jgi:hypothetical protein
LDKAKGRGAGPERGWAEQENQWEKGGEKGGERVRYMETDKKYNMLKEGTKEILEGKLNQTKKENKIK